MARTKNLIIGGVVLIVLAGAAWLTTYKGDTKQSNGVTDPAMADPAPQSGYRAPAFALGALDSDKVVKLADLQGKPVVVNFWASWCGPCRSETPDLQATYEKYRDQVNFFAINLTSQDDLKNANKFLQELQISVPVLKDVDGAAQLAYKVNSVPTTFVIDRKGVVRERREGALTKIQMDGMVQRTIAAQKS
ncbi:TlpA family protein disulfide reductase [Tumebacillus sp. ITR2]|uniref:TlpA family protein disulfide reductase n=1 Tax=Tumebacillus amylolyticus TaxID=2801339 RepID=A0ABS1JAC4_9BACL|nr:TlpA disulfide reductase family protein [Tumebacillus amylolyticus]MBL0386563.1 TlpA family protein disulfide reductase [Tumebacillus amylolyticus]